MNIPESRILLQETSFSGNCAVSSFLRQISPVGADFRGIKFISGMCGLRLNTPIYMGKICLEESVLWVERGRPVGGTS